jgi:hypothetical protein
MCIMSTDLSTLRQLGVQFDNLIAQQAQALVERASAPKVAALKEALAAFGIAAQPVVRFVEIWEDYAWGQLPPKLIAELTVAGREGTITTRFDVPVGAFHSNQKSDQIFELCMLRAEARQELGGGGDGHVMSRMRGLLAMIESGHVTFGNE